MAKATDMIALQENTEAEILREQAAEAYNEMQNMQLRLEEQMTALGLMLDNQGWTDLTAYPEDGPTLAQVQHAGRQLRSLTGLNSPIGRGARLRYANIWQGGIQHGNIPGSTRGRGTNVQAIINDPVNQANFFGPAARERQEKACYTNGHYFVIGEDARPATRSREATPKRLRNLPLYQITAAYLNPDDPTEVWAVRRSWSPDGIVEAPETVRTRGDLNHEWIWLNRFVELRPRSIQYNGANETVAQNKVLFMEQVNRLDGWTWGLPDAIAAIAWADQHRKGVLNGLKMQEALATLAFKLKGSTAASANAAAAKVSTSAVKGGTAAMVEGMDVAALATAGQGYDFDSLRPVLALVASAVDVSVVALSSDPGAAGSSYGAGQLLDLPTRLTMEMRRLIHIEFEKEILDWLGAPNATVTFHSMLDGAELYRMMQAILLPYMDGLYEPQEKRDHIDALMGWPGGTVPEGALIPNNAMSLPRRDIDTDATVSSTVSPGASVAAPDQGRSDGVGGQGTDSGNSIRTDTIT